MLEYKDRKYQQTRHSLGHRLQRQLLGHTCWDRLDLLGVVVAHRLRICHCTENNLGHNCQSQLRVGTLLDILVCRVHTGTHIGHNLGHTGQFGLPVHMRQDMLVEGGCFLSMLAQVQVQTLLLVCSTISLQWAS